MTERLEIIIIEVPKAIRKYKENKEDKISQWMMFIDNPNKEEVNEIMRENVSIKEAVKELDEISSDDTLRRIAELKEKRIRDDKAALDYAIEKGLAEGLAKGMAKGKVEGRTEGRAQGEHKRNIEIAKQMLRENLDIELIMKITNLSKEEIEKMEE